MQFDKFDLKDALSGLWRFKWIYGVFVAVVLICMAGSFYLKPQSQGEYSDRFTESIQGFSTSYTISPKAGVDYNFSGDNKDWITLSKNLAAYYKSLLTTDLCNRFVYEELCKKYAQEDLLELEKFRLQHNIKADSLPVNIPLEYTTVSVVPDTSVLAILAVSPDMEFSKNIVSAYSIYLEKELAKTGAPAAEIKYLGGTEQMVDPQTTKSAPKISNPVKLMVVFLGITIIYCLTVFAYVLFFPVINRKSDFEIYGIPVIAEILRKAKERI